MYTHVARSVLVKWRLVGTEDEVWNLRAAHSVVIVRSTFVHLPDLLLINLTEVCFETKIVGINILILGLDGPHLLVTVVPDEGPGAVVHDALVVIILSITDLQSKFRAQFMSFHSYGPAVRRELGLVL